MIVNVPFDHGLALFLDLLHLFKELRGCGRILECLDLINLWWRLNYLWLFHRDLYDSLLVARPAFFNFWGFLFLKFLCFREFRLGQLWDDLHLLLLCVKHQDCRLHEEHLNLASVDVSRSLLSLRVVVDGCLRVQIC